MDADLLGRAPDAREPLSDEVEAVLDRLNNRWAGRWDNEAHYWTHQAPTEPVADESTGDSEIRRLLASLTAVALPDELRALPLADLLRYRRKTRAFSDEQKQLAQDGLDAKKQDAAAQFRAILQRDFLGADAAAAMDPTLLSLTGDDRLLEKARFVFSWTHKTLGWKLSHEQAESVASVTGNVLVTARAGSGKTRTLVTRALFLQSHCGVSPREIVLLAFNKQAAKSMRDQLTPTLGDDLPHVLTFHALAYALVHPQESLLYDDETTNQLALSRPIQEIIDEEIRSGEYRGQIRTLMLDHYRKDWEAIVDGGFLLTIPEFVEHRRSLPRASLDGTYVKSFGERVIANALFENGVDFKYERAHRWSGSTYKPDFTIGNSVVVEYFGLLGEPDYDVQADEKRAYWAKREEWSLIELTARDLASRGEDDFVAHLLGRLQELGVTPEFRS